MRRNISLLVGACLVIGCKSARGSNRREAVPSAPRATPPPAPAAYPAGHWRLVPFSELDSVVLWVSHILIRHAGSTLNGQPGFRALTWNPDPAPPKRSRSEALALATRLSGRLHRHPELFSDLARRYSEDLSTRAVGGSLGGVRATQLAPALLDALQVIPPNGISEVIETPYGFHILKKSPPPLSETVGGRHIVIRYAGTVMTELLGAASRTREEAFELARFLSRSSLPFSELVQRYSESEDRSRNGDIGVWSTDAPENNGRILETLSKLKIGEVSEPVDSAIGFQVLKRTPITPRRTFAVTAIRLRYDPTLPANEPGSRANIATQAAKLARKVHSHPALFKAVQKRNCCDEILQWEEGKGSPALELSVAGLKPGEIAYDPVDIGWFYLIPMKLEVRSHAAAPVRYGLPSPSAVDIRPFLAHSTSTALASTVLALRAEAHSKYRLQQRQQQVVDNVLRSLADDFSRSRTLDERLHAQTLAQATLEAQLGADTARDFRRYSEAWLTALILKRSSE